MKVVAALLAVLCIGDAARSKLERSLKQSNVLGDDCGGGSWCGELTPEDSPILSSMATSFKSWRGQKPDETKYPGYSAWLAKGVEAILSYATNKNYNCYVALGAYSSRSSNDLAHAYQIQALVESCCDNSTYGEAVNLKLCQQAANNFADHHDNYDILVDVFADAAYAAPGSEETKSWETDKLVLCRGESRPAKGPDWWLGQSLPISAFWSDWSLSSSPVTCVNFVSQLNPDRRESEGWGTPEIHLVTFDLKALNSTDEEREQARFPGVPTFSVEGTYSENEVTVAPYLEVIATHQGERTTVVGNTEVILRRFIAKPSAGKFLEAPGRQCQTDGSCWANSRKVAKQSANAFLSEACVLDSTGNPLLGCPESSPSCKPDLASSASYPNMPGLQNVGGGHWPLATLGQCN